MQVTVQPKETQQRSTLGPDLKSRQNGSLTAHSLELQRGSAQDLDLVYDQVPTHLPYRSKS